MQCILEYLEFTVSIGNKLINMEKNEKSQIHEKTWNIFFHLKLLSEQQFIQEQILWWVLQRFWMPPWHCDRFNSMPITHKGENNTKEVFLKLLFWVTKFDQEWGYYFVVVIIVPWSEIDHFNHPQLCWVWCSLLYAQVLKLHHILSAEFFNSLHWNSLHIKY